jgi:hypothetical protein
MLDTMACQLVSKVIMCHFTRGAESSVVGSYPVLFVSVAAHAAQFAFLLWFENPRKLPRDPRGQV